MKPPRFWFREPDRPGLWPALLSPIAALYAAGTRRRLAKAARERVGVPVIAIGNVNMGGTGKTPTVIALVQALIEMGQRPAVVTRGYGGSITGPYRVNAAKDRAEAVGDEALLVSAFAPVFVSRDRTPGAKMAVAEGHDVIVLDDALQNPALHHDLTITVVDTEVGFGNGRVCPSGPLREPVAEALQRTDIVVAIGKSEEQGHLRGTWPILADKPMIGALLQPLETGFSWGGLRAYAFAGIGRPQKFFKSLKEAGAELIATRSFDDHAPLSLAVLKRMQAEAWAKAANLVTTEKDAARLPPEMRTEVMTFPVRLIFDDPERVNGSLSALFVKRR